MPFPIILLIVCLKAPDYPVLFLVTKKVYSFIFMKTLEKLNNNFTLELFEINISFFSLLLPQTDLIFSYLNSSFVISSSLTVFELEMIYNNFISSKFTFLVSRNQTALAQFWCHLPIMSPWVNYLTVLRFSFLICKMEAKNWTYFMVLLHILNEENLSQPSV